MAFQANLGLIPRPQDDLELADFEGEGVLYCHEKMTMIYLNESASVIWRLCDGRRTVKEIVSALAEAFPEAANEVSLDVPEIIAQFAREGVLELGES